ncbi:GrpB family protein [Curtobacterium sp. MCPF17_031]|uniref:GrpB family protein n=1 Tax=Curtobacterium sp. MCPF17_031 TaxID=2175653 RepID=UPI000DA80197|nr:GrpB family protein [Curtobacterium sp. MCPF17_031]PZE34481.1 hypothetical protein DEJ31_14635 [Curtobacterium sp. MCPF17_031]
MSIDPAERSGSRPTLEAIARQASVSLATVSKVLNGRSGVSEPTRERVERLLAGSGYAQRDTPPGPGSLVELVVEDLASEWSIEIVRGVESVAREHGYALSLSALGPDHAVGQDWITGVLHRRPAAIVLQFSALTAGRRDQLRARGIPFTVVDPVGDPPADVPVVGATNTAGGAAATQHLLDLGHAHIAAIAGPIDMACAVDRLAGHRAALAAAGLEARRTSVTPDPSGTHGPSVVVARFSREDGERAARELLAAVPRPTAIVTGNDLQALGVLDAARSLGLRVPGDLSVVGFDDVAPARWARPALTTIRQPLREMAERATRMALRATRMALRQHADVGTDGHASGAPDEPVRVELATTLVVRDSTAAPGVGAGDEPPVRRDATAVERRDVTTVEIVGGPEALRVGLHEHDPAWGVTFAEHRERILRAVAPLDVQVEHIGSTSVPGLAAKPIVDLVVVVPDVTDESAYLGPLLRAGYELRVREPGHRLVRTPTRDVHVHVYGRGATAVDDYLLLRDRLRTDPDDRALYEATKRALLSGTWDDMNDYADAKTHVIRAVVERARAAAVLPQ